MATATLRTPERRSSHRTWDGHRTSNERLLDDSYVIVAHGRDYGDVPTLRGVIFTEGGDSRLHVTVDMTAEGCA